MATKYFMLGGVDSVWNTDTNWSTTASSGPNNTTHAVAGDDVILDAGSPACTVSGTSACATLVCTGYTNTLTISSVLTLTSTLTLAAGMTVSGTSDILCTGTATLTNAGATYSAGLAIGGAAQTYTLADAWVITGRLKVNTGATPTLNSSTLSAAGLDMSGSNGGNGTTVITLTGGTWSGSGQCKNPLTFAGNVTVSGGVNYAGLTLTYTSGTITTTGSTVTISGGNQTWTTNGITWNNVTDGGSSTITINSLCSVAGTLTLNNNDHTFAGSAGWTCATLSYTGTTSNRTLNLLQTNTYTVTNALSLTGGTTGHLTVASSSGTLRVPFTFSGSTQSLNLINATRVDSSGGNRIHAPGGTLTDDINWDTLGSGSVMWLFS